MPVSSSSRRPISAETVRRWQQYTQHTPWQRRQARAGIDSMPVDTLILQFAKPGDGVVTDHDGMIIPPEDASPAVFPLIKREHIRHSDKINPEKHAEISEALVVYEEKQAQQRFHALAEKRRLEEHDAIIQNIRWLFDGGEHYAQMKQQRENIRLARAANARREIFNRPNLNLYRREVTSIQSFFRDMYLG